MSSILESPPTPTKRAAVDSGSLTARVRSWGRGKQAVALVALLLTLLAVVNEISQSLVPDRRSAVGPVGSSFSTSAQGTAAWVSLLEQSGQTVSQRREPLGSGQPLSSDAALVVLAGDVLLGSDVQATKRFLANGGLVITDASGPLTRKLFPDVTIETTEAANPLTDTVTIDPSADPFTTRGASTLPVGTTLIDRASLPSGARSVFANNDGVLVAEVTPLDGGTVILLANSVFLSNIGLATADSAAYALALPDGRPLLFAEEHHGYGSSQRLSGLPARWRWSLVLFAMAGLAAMWSQGRRNGPPEPATRELPPPRRRTIDVVATSIVRSWSANGGAPIETPRATNEIPSSTKEASP